MSDRGSKSFMSRRLPAILVALSIGAAGIAWTGCGGNSDSSSSEAQERIEKGAEEAQKGIEKGKQEAQKGIEKGKQEAQRGIEEAEKYLQE